MTNHRNPVRGSRGFADKYFAREKTHYVRLVYLLFKYAATKFYKYRTVERDPVADTQAACQQGKISLSWSHDAV